VGCEVRRLGEGETRGLLIVKGCEVRVAGFEEGRLGERETGDLGTGERRIMN